MLSFGSGRDIVTDFADGVDFLRLNGFGDVEDIESHIRQRGDDVVIAMNDRDVLVLRGIDVTLVDGNDFS